MRKHSRGALNRANFITDLILAFLILLIHTRRIHITCNYMITYMYIYIYIQFYTIYIYIYIYIYIV